MTHFSQAELGCRCGCGLHAFQPGFLDEIEALRLEFNEPMAVNSACRCAKHNGTVGGHPNSLHVGDREQHPGQRGTLAVDISAKDGAFRGRLFALAWRRGWSIGWNAKVGFLHLDRRVDIGLPQTSFDY